MVKVKGTMISMIGKTYRMKCKPSFFVTKIIEGEGQPPIYLQWTTKDGDFYPIGVISLINEIDDENYEVPVYNQVDNEFIKRLQYNKSETYEAFVNAPDVVKYFTKWMHSEHQGPRDLTNFMIHIHETQIEHLPVSYGGKGSRPTAKVTEWKSTGRKVKVEGGRHKLVYRNRAGDLRVRKVTVNKQGHRVTRYVKY
jgi:hypothetical protein